jgi:ribose/xylose/arabinose/galactoside ABC-type transport system permease subunit
MAEEFLRMAQVRRVVLFRFVGRSGLLGVLVLLCILAAVISPGFLQVANLINVLRQMSLYGIVSIGMTFVILTAGIDLSVGSTVGIVAIVITQIVNGTLLPPWVALGIGIIVGGLVGAAILAVLANVLNLAGVTPFTQQIVTGALIIVAVFIEMLKEREK